MSSLREPAHAHPFGLDVAEMREWKRWHGQVRSRLLGILNRWGLSPSTSMLRDQLRALLEDLDGAETSAEQGVTP